LYLTPSLGSVNILAKASVPPSCDKKLIHVSPNRKFCQSEETELSAKMHSP